MYTGCSHSMPTISLGMILGALGRRTRVSAERKAGAIRETQDSGVKRFGVRSGAVMESTPRCWRLGISAVSAPSRQRSRREEVAWSISSRLHDM